MGHILRVKAMLGSHNPPHLIQTAVLFKIELCEHFPALLPLGQSNLSHLVIFLPRVGRFRRVRRRRCWRVSRSHPLLSRFWWFAILLQLVSFVIQKSNFLAAIKLTQRRRRLSLYHLRCVVRQKCRCQALIFSSLPKKEFTTWCCGGFP